METKNSVFTTKEGYGVVARSITLNTQQSFILGQRLQTLGFLREWLEEMPTSYNGQFVKEDGTVIEKGKALQHLDDLGNMLSHLAEIPSLEEADMFAPRYENSNPA